MEKKYNVVIYPAAQNDLIETVDYLNTLSPDAAVKYYELIVTRIMTLSHMPERRPLARDAQLRLKGYRTLPVGSYIVFFVISGSTVEIRRILYNRRQYESLL